MELTAYELFPNDWIIEPAPARRIWMDKSFHGAANRCLPLVMANQMGWIVRCPTSFRATWNSHKPGPAGLSITCDDPRYSQQIVSRFGSGIVSFALPWLFRTSDSYGLLVRGPTNHLREDALPLDGLVETDWAPYTFTMNWKIIAHMKTVRFEKDDPICMLVPFPMSLLEDVQVAIKPLASNPTLAEDYSEFSKRRAQQMQQRMAPDESPNFRLDYLRGRKPDGERASEHKTVLKLARFT